MSAWDNDQQNAKDEIKDDLKRAGKELLYGIPAVFVLFGFLFLLYTHPFIVLGFFRSILGLIITWRVGAWIRAAITGERTW